MKPLRLRLGSRLEVDSGLAFSEVGLRESRGGRSDYANGYPGWSFFLFHDGAEAEINGTWTELPPRTVIAWGPRMAQRYGRRAGRFEHSWLRGSGPELDRLLQTHALISGRPQPMADAASGERFFRDILAEYRNRVRPDPETLYLRTALWLRELARDRTDETETAPPIPPGFLRARDKIETALDVAWDLAALADLAECTTWHFCRRFRGYFGLSPMALRRQRRLELATVLLGDHARSVSEVAEACGFNDAFYFSRAFKNAYACSPREWRHRAPG